MTSTVHTQLNIYNQHDRKDYQEINVRACNTSFYSPIIETIFGSRDKLL